MTAPGSADTVFRGAAVIDGSGAARFTADVAVSGAAIAAVGDLGGTRAQNEIDAAGLCLAPGFIDVHTHDDRLLLSDPTMAPKASQGVTTVIAGNCGISLAPLALKERPPPPLDLLGDAEWWRFGDFGGYVETLGREPAATNAALLVGHSTLRMRAMDRLDRAATDAEIGVMGAILGDCMQQGAIGLSTGLFYPPARHAPASETEAVAAVVRDHGGIYATHMRDEADHLEESVEETLCLGRHAGVPCVISHHKAVGPDNFGKVRQTLATIAKARETQPVGLDVYPYAASSTVLHLDRASLGIPVLLTWSVPHPEMTGRYLDDIRAEWDCTLPEAVERLSPAGAIYFQMDEADVQEVLRFPHAMIGSDGLPHDARPHPRLWGTFPRVLGHYARDLGLMSLEEAVRRMTGLPAAEFGLRGRGSIVPGAFADLVLFDLETVIDRATFDDPTLPSAGIELVMVNGQPVWRDGAATGARPGQVLRREAA